MKMFVLRGRMQPQPAPTLVLNNEAPSEKHGSQGCVQFCDDVRLTATISIGSLLEFVPWGVPTGIPGGDMSTKRRKRVQDLPVLHPDAAGIDIGASEVFVAVPADRDPEPVRSFTTFTRDLNAAADWLQKCGIRSVAMESTSVYWIPLHQILETRGFEVYLVNAQHVKNVPGRKTDVSDCQWDSILTLRRFVTSQLSATGSYLCHSFVMATSGEPDPNGGSRACNAYTESPGSDESASAQGPE
jgi:hypothetical protein